MILVDRLGRKILLIISDFLMCISIIGLATYFYLDENKACPPALTTTAASASYFNHSGDAGPSTFYMLGDGNTGISIGITNAYKIAWTNFNSCT